MRIFISYRHSDSVAATAALLLDRLGGPFGGDSVFLDSDGLALGDQFPDKLSRQLANCNVFIALIDPHWLASVGRLQTPADWVRRELEAALRRLRDDGVLVVPLLLQGANMPDAATLPASLAALCDQHAMPLRSATLAEDIATLAQRLQHRLTLPDLLLWLQARRRAALALALALVLLFAASVAALFDWLTLDTRLEALTLAFAETFDATPPHPQLALVAIDSSTVAALSGRAFDKTWRHEHAQVLRRLADAGAAAVAIDVYFDSPADPALDAELLAATAYASSKGTSVVLGTRNPAGSGTPSLSGPSVKWGLLCLGDDLDWARLAALAVRRPALLGGKDGATSTAPETYLPSLDALAVAPLSKALSFEPDSDTLIGLDHTGKPLPMAFSRTEQVAGQQACGALQKHDTVAQKVVRLTRLDLLRDPARRHPYQDLLGPARPDDAAVYRGKTVLVGVALDGLDQRTLFRGLRIEQRYGYELHADVINNLLQKIDIHALSPLGQFVVMLAMGAMGLMGRFWRTLLRPLWGRAFVVAVPLAYLALGAWLCAEFQVLLNSAYHLAAFTFAYWVSGVLLRRRGLLGAAGV